MNKAPMLAAMAYALTIGSSDAASRYSGYVMPGGVASKPKRKSDAKTAKKRKQSIAAESRRKNRK